MIDLEHLSHAGRAHVAFGVSSASSHTALALILRLATPISQELTLLAKRAARKVSWKLLSAGFRFTSISVLEFPPGESGWERGWRERILLRVYLRVYFRANERA